MEVHDFIAGVELGGTKAVAVLARGDAVIARTRFRTTSPDETLGALRNQLTAWQASARIASLGIASFGPVRVDQDAPDYGTMLATPKTAWSGAAIAEQLTADLSCPWRLDTDVNGAALAEWRWGAGQGLSSLCYLTLGTGVGGGFLFDGNPVHGALHPEIGHLRLRRAHGDTFPGVCPFHGDCLEGLISGPALQARFNRPSKQVPANDPRWLSVAHDLAELVAALNLMASPQRVLIGGGIGMGRPFLLELVRERFVNNLSGYLPHVTPVLVEALIAQPSLGDDAGPLGAIALGQLALAESQSEAGDHE